MHGASTRAITAHFEIQAVGQRLWTSELLDESEMTVAESHRPFLSRTQAFAAAPAIDELVARASRSLSGGASSGLL